MPGLIDSHMHVIRGGLNYNLELRWDGVRSPADAMAMLRAQVTVTPPPQWVRVVGGFTEHQFAEKRLPTPEEPNAVAPDTPVFILHLYDRALLNGAALRAVGYDRDTPDPPGGEIRRDGSGTPTGLLLARPNASILYTTLARGPRLPPEYQLNSTRHFMRGMNRLGVTSVIDAGGGFQNEPEDYAVIEQLHRPGEYFAARYGAGAAERSPPVARMLAPGVPVGAGTDATRVASYNPWVSLAWLVTGRTLGGLQLYPPQNRLDRETALGLWTRANGWFSREEGKKGQIKVGQLADMAVLDRGYCTVPEDEIQDIESLLTILGGRVVHARGDHAGLAPELPPATPDWSPVRRFGGYRRRLEATAGSPHVTAACGCATACRVHGHAHDRALAAPSPARDETGFWGALGCTCWAF